MNFITASTTIEDLFNNLEDIFGNTHRKKHTVEMF